MNELTSNLIGIGFFATAVTLFISVVKSKQVRGARRVFGEEYLERGQSTQKIIEYYRYQKENRRKLNNFFYRGAGVNIFFWTAALSIVFVVLMFLINPPLTQLPAESTQSYDPKSWFSPNDIESSSIVLYDGDRRIRKIYPLQKDVQLFIATPQGELREYDQEKLINTFIQIDNSGQIHFIDNSLVIFVVLTMLSIVSSILCFTLSKAG